MQLVYGIAIGVVGMLVLVMFATPSNWQWYRRLRGGHWERWYVNLPVGTTVWIRRDRCYRKTGTRPGLCEGIPRCEGWKVSGETIIH